jgi:hypothetical protein
MTDLAIDRAAIKADRRRLWRSGEGCTCKALTPRNQRCSLDAIRCKGRLDRVIEAYEVRGYTVGEPQRWDIDALALIRTKAAAR